MRIIKPYGESRTELTAQRKRVLYDKTTGRERHEIGPFAETHGELVIAQWISVIDKIATKPQGQQGATEEQYKFRDRLGKAAWNRIIGDGRLQFGDPTREEFLTAVWNFKIHPYGSRKYIAKRRGPGDHVSAPSARGRWYMRFAGDNPPDRVNVDEVVGKISEHLYSGEFRKSVSAKVKTSGQIAARAASIEKNVLRVLPSSRVGWTKADEAQYAKSGDVAAEIHRTVADLERSGKRISLEIAGRILFAHWAKIFCDPSSGKPLGVTAARISCPGLFSLHMAIKDAYARILKRQRKSVGKRPKKGPLASRRISIVLPKDMLELMRLISAQKDNQNVNRLIRLGRIIHYSASGGQTDSTVDIEANWPTDVSESKYWTSDGQAKIKRAEAFVRVWRHLIAIAGLTLLDWASMRRPFPKDILGGGGAAESAVHPDNFSSEQFDRKATLLFGSYSKFFATDENSRKAVLKFAIDGMTTLRNHAFHFKGLREFLFCLDSLSSSESIRTSARQLWEADASQRNYRLRAMLRTAHAEFYSTQAQCEALIRSLTMAADSDLPLPRFSRILRRAENAWTREAVPRLPPSANRSDLEQPWRLYQYTSLKLLYERPFRTWLESRTADELSAWIDRAVKRSTDAAHNLNFRDDAVARKVIVARVASLPRPAEGNKIRDFFFDLSSATASEMRIQRGYESDAEKAREQAEYIEDLLCDVIILALGEFLSREGLSWVLIESVDPQCPAVPKCQLDAIELPAPDLNAEDWQVLLYFLLHLVPVDDVARLHHQLAKWQITAGRRERIDLEEKKRLQRLQSTLKLYLDMHDAKFEGGAALGGCEEFREFFETDAGFNKIFPMTITREEDLRLPRRGLREIMRFGHFRMVGSFVPGQKITNAEIEDYLQAIRPARPTDRSSIAIKQALRERLHEKWSKARPRRLSGEECKTYCEVLKTIVKHRQVAARVNLITQVHFHRLMMAVLGRLADYSGLFERDLYFVTLATLYQGGLSPQRAFNDAGLRFLKQGRILSALEQLNGGQADQVYTELRRFFGPVWEKSDARRRIRNNLAHFNMLRPHGPPPELTEWVNHTRRLMDYDRKLKNAVSQSIREMLKRDGIDLTWRMEAGSSNHRLTNAVVSSARAIHLGGLRLVEFSRPVSKPAIYRSITEALHDRPYVQMVATLFGGKVQDSDDITGLELSKIDWQSVGRHENDAGRNGPRGTPRRPLRSEKKRREYSHRE